MEPASIHAWETFARERGFRFTPPAAYPEDDLAIEARVDGIDVTLTTRRREEGIVETRIRAAARHAMRGRVEIRTARWNDGLVGLVRGRRSTGAADVDEALSTFTSSEPLLRAILDERMLETLRVLKDKRRMTLAYEDGAIAIRWEGVERSPAVLDSALGLAAYLAVSGIGERSPYR